MYESKTLEVAVPPGANIIPVFGPLFAVGSFLSNTVAK
jgi:hypothetical protein